MYRFLGLTPKFFGIDAKSAIFLVPFLLHISSFTFFLSISAVLVFSLLDRQGISISVFLRMLKIKIFGGIRPCSYNENLFRTRTFYY